MTADRIQDLATEFAGSFTAGMVALAFISRWAHRMNQRVTALERHAGMPPQDQPTPDVFEVAAAAARVVTQPGRTRES